MLKEKVETLRLLNNKILALYKDDEIEEEIEEADGFRETFQLAFGRIEAALSSQPSCAHLTDASNVESASTEEAVGISKPRVTLPKLGLKKFNGDVSKWHPFWDTFQSTIHNNSSLAAINYII